MGMRFHKWMKARARATVENISQVGRMHLSFLFLCVLISWNRCSTSQRLDSFQVLIEGVRDSFVVSLFAFLCTLAVLV
jgi:hypothetical protein